MQPLAVEPSLSLNTIKLEIFSFHLLHSVMMVLWYMHTQKYTKV